MSTNKQYINCMSPILIKANNTSNNINPNDMDIQTSNTSNTLNIYQLIPYVSNIRTIQTCPQLIPYQIITMKYRAQQQHPEYHQMMLYK